MNNQNLITPPPELIKQWWHEAQKIENPSLKCWINYVAICIAQWSADQELEACLTEISFLSSRSLANKIRVARRSKPPSLKQSLEALGRFNSNAHTNSDEMMSDFDLLRRALERLDD